MQEFVDIARSNQYTPLNELINDHYNWSDYFNNIMKYYTELEANNFHELEYDWEIAFTLDYTIYAIREELHETVSRYIDEKQVVENWIRRNGVPNEYKKTVWTLYEILNNMY